LIAIFLVAFAASWQFASTVFAQEAGAAEPRRLLPNQQGAVSGAIPQKAPVFESGQIPPSFFQRPIEDKDDKYGAKQTSAATTPDRPALQSGVRHAGFDSPVKQEPGTAPRQQSTAAPLQSAVQNPASAAPRPLPISRSNLASPGSAVENNEAISTGDGMPGIDSLLTVAGSLGIVMGLFLVTMWCLRRGMPKAARPLPSEVVEVLGRVPLAGRQQMHLIRFGSKLVLAAVSPSGIDAVSEITDPIEADRLLGYCEQTRSSSATSSFRGILDRLDERSPRNADEHGRRPHREYSSLVGHKNVRMEDEYA
jgi:flagellar biogenesis protein FliO